MILAIVRPEEGMSNEWFELPYKPSDTGAAACCAGICARVLCLGVCSLNTGTRVDVRAHPGSKSLEL